MNDVQGQTDLDNTVRRCVYERFMSTGRAPLAKEVSGELGLSVDEAMAAFRRLADAHVLVLQPVSGEILMANPFSAVPTPFMVRVGGVQYWANCIWDALGVAAMLKRDARIETGCGDCNEAMALEIKDRIMGQTEGIIHFAIPAHRWWDNIVFT